jgi:hypothetical protein
MPIECFYSKRRKCKECYKIPYEKKCDPENITDEEIKAEELYIENSNLRTKVNNLSVEVATLVEESHLNKIKQEDLFKKVNVLVEDSRLNKIKQDDLFKEVTVLVEDVKNLKKEAGRMDKFIFYITSELEMSDEEVERILDK